MATGDRRKTFAVTALDVWQRWAHDDGDEDREPPSVEDLRRELLGRAQTDKMIAGLAGHKVLEEIAAGNESSIINRGIEVRGFSDFDHALGLRPGSSVLAASAGTYTLVELNTGALVPVALKWELREEETLRVLPVRESKVELEFPTSRGLLLAKGRVDGGDGLEVVDYKFSGRPDIEALERSWQWQIYLLATGARRFRWEVFTVREPLKNEEAYRIVKRQTSTQYAYPEMRAEVTRAVENFAAAIDEFVPEYWDRARSLEAPAVDEEE